MQTSNRRAMLASFVVGVVATVGTGAAVAQSTERPDFSGVWGTAVGGGGFGGGRGGGAPALKPEAQAKVDEYNALTRPAGITPGMYCLGSGMPASMLGSGCVE